MKTQTFTDTLVIEECYECHTSFGITRFLYDQCRNNGRTFWCPNGHSQVFSTTEVQRLNKKMRRLHAELGETQKILSAEEYEHKKTRQSRAAIKGVLTKTKNKLAKGICPLCDQHFPDVENHMSNEHPNYIEDKSDDNSAAQD